MRSTYLIMMLALAACQKQEPTAANGQAPSAFEQELRALPDPGRNLAFRNAILDAGLKCERVDASRYQSDVKGGGMWVAHCTDLGDVAVFVSDAGYAQIRRCVDLEDTEAPKCAE